MQVRDVMNYECVVVSPEVTVQKAAQKMDEYDVGVLPVCDAGRLVGVITDRDIVLRAVALGRDTAGIKVREVMTTDPSYCYEDDEAPVAAKTMEDRKIRRLPILSRNDRLVGIVSLRDLQVCRIIS
ncbi:MAG TPA: CBS domain-containing protein [Dehalococcoidia bacterium]|nr:CBS domain-containing protein [Dehalococcoidia bacterium]